MECTCGHGISKHDMGGCQHTVRKTDEFDLVCKCGLTPDAIADAQLDYLRKAGEKMADALRISKEYSEYCKRHPEKIIEYIEIFNLEDAAALAEWEAANK